MWRDSEIKNAPEVVKGLSGGNIVTKNFDGLLSRIKNKETGGT